MGQRARFRKAVKTGLERMCSNDSRETVLRVSTLRFKTIACDVHCLPIHPLILDESLEDEEIAFNELMKPIGSTSSEERAMVAANN
jgi:hypothetical protein